MRIRQSNWEWFMPYFNCLNNDDLILVIQSIGVDRERNSFHKKSKSTEKNPESEEDLLEHRTDGTDALIRCILGVKSFHSMIFMDIRRGKWDKNTLLFLL